MCDVYSMFFSKGHKKKVFSDFRELIRPGSVLVLEFRTYMARSGYLGEFEQIVLLAVLRLGNNSYGVPIRQEIETRTGRMLTVGALYSALERLEDKGYLTSHYGDPTPERGGRSRRYFKVKPLGLRVLREARDELAAMWEGLDLQVSHGR